jgi:hypothetical protein
MQIREVHCEDKKIELAPDHDQWQAFLPVVKILLILSQEVVATYTNSTVLVPLNVIGMY